MMTTSVYFKKNKENLLKKEFASNEYSIYDDNNNIVEQRCCSIIKSKKSLNYGKICGRRALYTKNNLFFCGLHKEKKKVTFIDLFSGIGSFHFAIKKIYKNSQCVLASDIDPNCNETYFKNYGIRPKNNILDLSLKQIPDADILFAGFPCQTFSLIGKKQGFTDLNTSNLFNKLIEILKYKEIKSFVFENVRNLVSMNKGSVLSKIISEFENLNYTVS